jgi:hypothetical protein
MGLSNNISKLALGRLIQTLHNLGQFSKKKDYCTIFGLLVNVSSGEWEKISVQGGPAAGTRRGSWQHVREGELRGDRGRRWEALPTPKTASGWWKRTAFSAPGRPGLNGSFRPPSPGQLKKNLRRENRMRYTFWKSRYFKGRISLSRSPVAYGILIANIVR